MNKKMISPIAIDLGAKRTGVYFAHYPEGSPLNIFKQKGTKEGKVYQLEKDSYTYLMAERTAKRHQKRGYDRRQMAKRLFKLIWCKHFKLPWDKDTQQVIGFLFNRRGFSFLTEEYDPERLSETPKEVLKLICNKLGLGQQNDCNLSDYLISWTNEGEDKVREIYDKICEEPERIRKRLVLISRTDNLYKYCKDRKDGKEINPAKWKKLSSLSYWILEEWKNMGIQGLPNDISKNPVDIIDYLNTSSKEISENIFNSINSIDQNPEQLEKEKKELKASDWYFNSKEFDFEKEKFVKLNEDENEDPIIKTYLHHFVFALHKTLSELESGGRHRIKYFNEVEEVLENNEHKHGYFKRFCDNLNSDRFNELSPESLKNLIGHISNLELKPLRKYFNDKKHRTEDHWNEDYLKHTFERWILKEWRVGEKDKNKVKGKFSHENLKNSWKDNKRSVVDFWLKTDPSFTIPPYQDSNNRRPPRCQSLLLNVNFLDREYSEWNEWLDALKQVPSVKNYIGDYEEKLKCLKSGKNKSYFNNKYTGQLKTDSGRRSIKDLDARVLQFVFDRVKAKDPLQLNEIYSHAKKIKQGNHKNDNSDGIKETRKKLDDVINKSELPDKFQTKPNYKKNELFSKGSFLHLVCRYYKQRQRAREGRIFIHPEYRFVKGRGYENTGRFDDSKHLLTYCNHKPRQKRYQMLMDLAALLQVSPDKLEKFLEKGEVKTVDKDDKLLKWLNNIEGLKVNCDRAAKEQKERRGSLKQDIQSVFGSSNPSDKKGLYSFCIRARDLCLKITEPLYNDSEQQKWKEALEINPASAVYILSQINNISFKERSGYASTCTVCSMDNAQRMQMVAQTAKAQRLPAIPTRIIDGAVMRMARIVGGEIAKDKWTKIEEDLKQGNKVCVPLITESNQFNFEPSREELVRMQRITRRKGKVREGNIEEIYQSKEERIKEAGNRICPYTGKKIHGNKGEIDHIIPRTSEWGTLNDEANLIWASNVGNHHKNNEALKLDDLSTEYKETVFPGYSNQQIKDWIKNQIDDGSSKDFKFGSYRSFINLNPDQQKAFRHALFLKKEDQLREKVIDAINHLNQTLVNGTQRYFAEVLANKLYKLAKKKNYENLLSFDYFGVNATPSSRGDSIYDLRKMYERIDCKISEYAKSKELKQTTYSHLLDAQMAFLIIADAHRKEGGLRLQIDDTIRKEPYDATTGEVHDEMFKAIQIKDNELQIKDLERRKVYNVETHHRQLIKDGISNAISISYKIHRDSLIAEKFLPLIELEDGNFKMGFSIDNSVDFKRRDFELIRDKFLVPYSNSYNFWLVNKRNALEYLMKVGSKHNSSEQEKKVAKILDKMIYRTIKKKVQSVLTLGNKAPQTVSDALNNWEKCIKDKDFKIERKKILLSVFHEWNTLKIEIEEASDNNPEQSLQEFLQHSKMFCDKQKSSIAKHNKKRKVFSLPVLANIGNIRLIRKGWNGKTIIQNVAEESLAYYGITENNGRPHTILSKNSIPTGHYSGIPKELPVEPIEWKKIPDKDIKEYNENTEHCKIVDGEVKYKDKGRCMAKLRVSDEEIKKLSIPKDKLYWKGKLLIHEDEDKREEIQEKRNGNNRYYFPSEWCWFDKPFELPSPKDTSRREVEIRKNDNNLYEIEFTIQKTAKVKKWL